MAFDEVKLGSSLVRTLLVQNPNPKSSVRVIFGQSGLEKAVKSGFQVDFADFLLGPNEEAEVKVGWTPKSGRNVREKIGVKYGSTGQTHFILLGTCIAPM